MVKTPNRTGLHYFLDTNANTAADFPVIICFPLSGIVELRLPSLLLFAASSLLRFFLSIIRQLRTSLAYSRHHCFTLPFLHHIPTRLLYVGLPVGCLDRVLHSATARSMKALPNMAMSPWRYIVGVPHGLSLQQSAPFRTIALGWRSLLGRPSLSSLPFLHYHECTKSSLS